ncbi:MAG: cation:proton antiporter [Clostridiales bacterium]|nr:cation:proton antiporter [Clostridiales bacterium]
MTLILSLAVAMLAGLIMSRPAKLVGFPAVTAYLIAGILIGPYCLGLLGVPGLGFSTPEQVDAVSVVSDIALGFIAFAIGNEFRLSTLRENGKTATVIGIIQAVVTSVVVDIALVVTHFIIPDTLTLPAAITLGAVAAATAPAATLMVVRQYKAHGHLTDLLLPIVALDDAVGLVIFAVSYGVAHALQNGDIDIITIVVNPIAEIIASLLLGSAMGAVLTFIERFFHSRSKRMSMCIAAVFLTVGLSMLSFRIGPVTVSFSSLLVCMMLGTIFCNMCSYSQELMERTDGWTAPLFILFFVLSGAGLRLDVFADLLVIAVGLIFIVIRSLGKWSGAFISSSMMKCDGSVRKYLGITLLPQAGVALGMSLQAAEGLGDDGALVRQIVLFSVLIFELFGPLATKIALTKAGEIEPEGKTSARKENPDLSTHRTT